MFDRVTGEPVWPIEERPVPAGDVPGEWYAPTQPFPTKPPAYDQQGVSVDDLIDFTPALRAEALAMLDDYVWGPFFTPPALIDDWPGGTQGTLVVPGLVGGSDWNGAGVDPGDRHPLRAVSAQRHRRGTGPLGASPLGRRLGHESRRGTFPARAGCRCSSRPTAGWWRSISTGATSSGRCPTARGRAITPPLRIWTCHASARADAPPRSSRRAWSSWARAPTSGRRSCPRSAAGRWFRAYDKATGAVVWEMELPGGVTSAPMTYMAGGRQYIVVVVGWDDLPSEYVALALP